MSRANGRGGGGSSLNRKQVEQMLQNIKEAYAKTDKLDVNGGRRKKSRVVVSVVKNAVF